MQTVALSVHAEVFRRCPGFRRGVVVIDGAQNEADAPALQQILAEAMRRAQTNPVDLENDPRVVVWQDAHQRFGSNPNRYPPAHLALRKRV